MAAKPPTFRLIQEEVWDRSGLYLEALCGSSIDAVAKRLGDALPPDGEFSFVFTDDATIADLNAQWRDRDGPTDVLSFPASMPGEVPTGSPFLLGDVIMAHETVAEAALKLGTPLADHVCHLLVHGMLHLLHYTHDDNEDAQTMQRLEAAVLNDLGLPDPYLLEEVRETSP